MVMTLSRSMKSLTTTAAERKTALKMAALVPTASAPVPTSQYSVAPVPLPYGGSAPTSDAPSVPSSGGTPVTASAPPQDSYGIPSDQPGGGMTAGSDTTVQHNADGTAEITSTNSVPLHPGTTPVLVPDSGLMGLVPWALGLGALVLIFRRRSMMSDGPPEAVTR